MTVTATHRQSTKFPMRSPVVMAFPFWPLIQVNVSRNATSRSHVFYVQIYVVIGPGRREIVDGIAETYRPGIMPPEPRRNVTDRVASVAVFDSLKGLPHEPWRLPIDYGGAARASEDDASGVLGTLRCVKSRHDLGQLSAE